MLFSSCVSFLQTYRRHDSHTVCTGESSEIFSSQPVLLIVLFENLADGQIKKKKKQPPDGMRLGFTGTSPQDHVGPATGSASRWCCLALAWDVRHSCAHFTQWKELRIQYCWIMLFKICMVADKAHAWIKSGHLILCGLSPHAESVFGDRCSGRRDLEECQWCYENIRKGVGDAFG